MKVFIVAPLCHGNGGWCGSKTLGKRKSLKNALAIRNPHFKFDWHYDAQWADSRIRICRTENPNNALYIFDPEDERWIKQ